MGKKRPKKKKVGRPPKLTKSLASRISDDWITDQEPGYRLPTEEQLIKQYAVNRKTVRAALEALENDSEIYRKPSGGAFVAQPLKEVWRQYWGKAISVNFQSALWVNDNFSCRVYGGIVRGMQATGMHVALPTRMWRFQNLDPEDITAHYQNPSLLGMVFVGRQSSEIQETLFALPLPKVTIDFDATADGLDSFCFDNFGAGRVLARRLHKLGHRQFAGLFESPNKPEDRQDEAWSERRRGFLKELEDLGGTRTYQIFSENRSGIEAYFARLQDLFRLPASDRPTAICLPTHQLEPVEQLAATEGLRIPRDLSVVGYGSPQQTSDLTAVRFDGENLGEAAISHLLRKFRDPKWSSRRAKLVRIKGYYSAQKSHGKAKGL